MRKITLLTIIFNLTLISKEIEPISSEVKAKMVKGNSWREGCPVKVEDLRLVKVPYFGFDNKSHIGEIIVHKSVAKEVLSIFKELKRIKYPIEKVNLVSKYGGNDSLSMKSNNTSAFNCRLMTGSRTKYSKHSYGKAIDINPIQNPYVKGKRVLPKEGVIYIGKNRIHLSNQVDDRAMLIKGDRAVDIFKKYGWIWGGDWRTLKDFQHFEKRYK
jgi:hypothetical protein